MKKHGIRDWPVTARRADTNVVVTVKIGRMKFAQVVIPLETWPKNLYDQRQAATLALAKAIAVPYLEWDSSELDRIPDEIAAAVNDYV